MKQVIIVRMDLKMGRGKMAAQAAHASVSTLSKVGVSARKEWEEEGMKKVVLKVSSEKDLIELWEQAKKEKLPCVIIRDGGRTQVEPGTITTLGIGPAEDIKIDKVTGKLKLL